MNIFKKKEKLILESECLDLKQTLAQGRPVYDKVKLHQRMIQLERIKSKDLYKEYEV